MDNFIRNDEKEGFEAPKMPKIGSSTLSCICCLIILFFMFK